MTDERDVICRCAGCGEPILLGDVWVIGDDGTYCEACIEASRDAAERGHFQALDEMAPAGPIELMGDDGLADPEVEPW